MSSLYEISAHDNTYRLVNLKLGKVFTVNKKGNFNCMATALTSIHLLGALLLRAHPISCIFTGTLPLGSIREVPMCPTHVPSDADLVFTYCSVQVKNETGCRALLKAY